MRARKQVLDTNFVLHYVCVMRNITISMDEDVAKWARVYAAEHDISVSRMLGEMLKEKMQKQNSYENAREKFLSKKPVVINEGSQPYPKRDDLYDG